MENVTASSASHFTAVMTRQDLGISAFVKAGNDHIIFAHCMIYRGALVVKKLHQNYTLFFDAVKIINFIKSRAFNSRLFKNWCIDMDSDYTSLLLHAEVRWLSRGRSLKRLFTLKDEVLIFLTDQILIWPIIFIIIYGFSSHAIWQIFLIKSMI